MVTVGFRNEPRAVADPGFPQGGGANSPGGRQHTILPNFPKNCMKLKEFGPPGGSARPWRPPLDPPMLTMEISGVVKFLYVGYTREDTISDLHSGIATADRVNFEQRPGRNKYMKD